MRRDAIVELIEVKPLAAADLATLATDVAADVVEVQTDREEQSAARPPSRLTPARA